MKTDSEADSDVSTEPYMAQGEEYRAEDEVPAEPMQEQTGELVESILWPPRVLEDQPLTLILKKLPGSGLAAGSAWRCTTCYFSGVIRGIREHSL